MVEILYLSFMLLNFAILSNRIDLNLLCLSGIWTNLMIQGSDIVVCGTLMWIHVFVASLDMCVMTRGQLSETRDVSMIHGVQSVLVWSIWVNHSCSHVSAITCLICLNLHLGHVLRHVEIFKYFLLYLLYVDNYFHRIKIYLQRKQCVLFYTVLADEPLAKQYCTITQNILMKTTLLLSLFYTVYDQLASQSKPVCIVQSF